MKKAIFLYVLFLLSAACSSNTPLGTDPLTVADAYMQAVDGSDINAVTRLLSDDIVFEQHPPGVRIDDKSQVVSILEEDMACGHRHSLIGQLEVEGEEVVALAKVRGDDFEILGIDHITATYRIHVDGGKVDSILVTLDEDDWAEVERKTSGGLGINIEFVKQGVRVKGFAGQSPAKEEGMQVGDIITAVDGIGCDTMERWEVICRLRGEEGSTVALTIVREGADAPMNMELTRQKLG